MAAEAQELEPRSYTNTPVGMNFLVGGYAYTEGDVVTDPSVPLSDAEVEVHTAVLAYARSFGLFGQSAKIDAIVPRGIGSAASDAEESAALRRVKRLEEAGVIAGYVALVRARRVGLGLAAYINVRMAKQASSDMRNPMDVFAAAVQAWPEVVECVSLTGEMDYLLKVLVADMEHYTRFMMDTLLRHPSVQDCRTSFVMRPFKTNVTLV